jgi:YD repeat-containing protein
LPQHYNYNKIDQPTHYLPPTIGLPVHETITPYTLDQQLAQIQRPDGKIIDMGYDAVSGRLLQLNLPASEQIGYDYDPNTGQLLTLTAPDGGTLSYTYDGALVLSEIWANGTVNGVVSQRRMGRATRNPFNQS